jgi:hypothetical protein
VSIFKGMGILSVVDWIHSKRLEGKPVLVHCDAGLTRSPAVVSAYLMKYGPDMSGRPLRYFEALQYVSQQRGPKVDVRLFERELLLLERHLQYIAGTLQLLSGDATPPERSPSPFDFGSPQVSSPMAVSLQLPTRLKLMKSDESSNEGPSPQPSSIWTSPRSSFQSSGHPTPHTPILQSWIFPNSSAPNQPGRNPRPPPLALPTSPLFTALPCPSDCPLSPQSLTT